MTLRSIFQATLDSTQLWARMQLKGRLEDFAMNLIDKLPGDKKVQVSSPKSGVLSTEIRSREQGGKDDIFMLKVSVNPGERSAKLDNFFITDNQQRGNGIGSQAIANFYSGLRKSDLASQINLTAELDCGAWVWGRMGWLPRESDFRRLQKNCMGKLQSLQEQLPESSKIGAEIYRVFSTLLDPEKTKDPRAIWPLVDSNVRVTVPTEDGEMKEMRLGFYLMQFESYRGQLEFSDQEQVARLESRLGDKLALEYTPQKTGTSSQPGREP